MSRATAELSWELVTGDGVVRVSADGVDAAARWGLCDPDGSYPDERELSDDEWRDQDLF